MLVTYLIPVYNENNHVQKAIQDAINLKIKKKEILIIDNGSCDGSQDVIKKFRNYKNVKIILRKKNLGYGATLRQGTKLAKGKYIYIHYSDNEYDIKTSVKMLDIEIKRDLDVVFASRLLKKLKSENFFIIILNRPFYLGSIILTNVINFLYKKKFTDIIGTKLYKKSSVINKLPKKKGLSFDLEFDAILCSKIFKSEEVFIKYEERKNFYEKKLKWWHIFLFLIGIVKVRFFYS